MAVNPATVQAIPTALAGALSPLLQQSPATAVVTPTGSPATTVTTSGSSDAGSDRYGIKGIIKLYFMLSS